MPPKLMLAPLTPICPAAFTARALAESMDVPPQRRAQAKFPALDIGSYPYYRPSGNGVAIVAKGNDPAAAEAAIAEVTQLMLACGATPIQGEPPEA